MNLGTARHQMAIARERADSLGRLIDLRMLLSNPTPTPPVLNPFQPSSLHPGWRLTSFDQVSLAEALGILSPGPVRRILVLGNTYLLAFRTLGRWVVLERESLNFWRVYFSDDNPQRMCLYRPRFPSNSHMEFNPETVRSQGIDLELLRAVYCGNESLMANLVLTRSVDDPEWDTLGDLDWPSPNFMFAGLEG